MAKNVIGADANSLPVAVSGKLILDLQQKTMLFRVHNLAGIMPKISFGVVVLAINSKAIRCRKTGNFT